MTISASRETEQASVPSILIISENRANAEALQLAIEGALDGLGTAAIVAGADVPRAVRESVVDVAVIDAPVRDGVRITRQLRMACPALTIVVYGIPEADRDIVAWVEAGALGCLAREAGLDELVRAIQDAIDGKTTCSASIAGTLVREISGRSVFHAELHTRNGLTTRELEVLRLVSHGLSNKEIAQTLSLQLPTVKNHVRHLLRKLGARNRFDAARYLTHVEVTETSGIER